MADRKPDDYRADFTTKEVRGFLRQPSLSSVGVSATIYGTQLGVLSASHPCDSFLELPPRTDQREEDEIQQLKEKVESQAVELAELRIGIRALNEAVVQMKIELAIITVNTASPLPAVTVSLASPPARPPAPPVTEGKAAFPARALRSAHQGMGLITRCGDGS